MASRSVQTIIVVTGGDALAPEQQLPSLPADAFVVAADSGVDRARTLGLHVDLAVGDFDSVTSAGLAEVSASGGGVERHPEAKDATDFELALQVAAARLPQRIIVLGGHGGRLDHLLANALLLAAPALAGVDEVVAQMGAARVTVVRRAATLEGTPGDLVSLLPTHGSAIGVRTAGLLYPLADEDLPEGSSRGVSNEFVSASADVSIRGGILLAVQPGVAGTHHLRSN